MGYAVTHVSWAPDSILLLVGTGNGEIYIYDDKG